MVIARQQQQQQQKAPLVACTLSTATLPETPIQMALEGTYGPDMRKLISVDVLSRTALHYKEDPWR
jgi:hypothetical protein